MWPFSSASFMEGLRYPAWNASEPLSKFGCPCSWFRQEGPSQEPHNGAARNQSLSPRLSDQHPYTRMGRQGAVCIWPKQLQIWATADAATQGRFWVGPDAGAGRDSGTRAFI